MDNMDAFLREYESVFNGPPVRGSLTSPQFPLVELRIFGSEQHKDGTCIEVYTLHADLAHRGQGREEHVLRWVQDIATKYGLNICTNPSGAFRNLYVDASFVQCEHSQYGELGYLEWPRCAHRCDTLVRSEEAGD